MKAKTIIRGLMALIFLCGAAANTWLILTNPEIYNNFAVEAFLDFYVRLWDHWVLPHLGWWMGAVILLELGIGLGLLASGRWVKWALRAALVFMILLVPFWWSGMALGNLALIAVLVRMGRIPYPETLTAEIKNLTD